ncbi:hypothetical protein L873DRAFT_1825040 [Choiromyces venosus 120613-1]|uniref:Cation-transporting ATPase n=1 Tax=Choiromyces venosus 120613-1 TaxID=1336337 RepID=A0A3N4KIU3_9PEZI|nr:hypothetical protein L873DRAFT_1825040 [Choiromyces venosus 120613-1]
MGDTPNPNPRDSNARPEHGSPRPAQAQHVQEPRQLHHYRRDSIASNASFYSEVEMAQNEVFAGPVSESLASSVTSFQHRRRSRADSNASWSFYRPQPGDEDRASFWEDEQRDDGGVIIDDDDDEYVPSYPDDRMDEGAPLRRVSSATRPSVEDPLLSRRDSATLTRDSKRLTQKIYILTEDLTIVVAGFTTSTLGYALYIIISTFTLGMGWLLLRWLPRWRVRLIGNPSSLRECHWVATENEWGEFVVQGVQKRQYGQNLSTVFGYQEKAPEFLDPDEDDDPVINFLRYLDYRYIRFCYHPLLDKFVLNKGWKDPNWDDVRSIRSGIDGDEKEQRILVFGDNVIDIEEKSTMQLLLDEAFHPFYVFQIASLVLWTIDDYYYYATCIFIISAISITSTLIETKSTMRRLREVSRFICDVRVLRNGFWCYVSSKDLVPGDVYEVTDPSLTLYPCDSILLTGDCIVNESMLTGKFILLLNLASSSILPELARHFLFSGTKIIRARRPQDGFDEEAVGLAMVVRTGFNTTKGALVRSMLFPKPTGFKFYRDSFYYIAVMSGIAACGFVASFINFVRLGLPWQTILVRALDLVTIVVPPALPATLTIGTNFAISRLKKKDVFCISPQRVNIGGKLDVVCFDKTGTLTEDGLDVLGVHAVDVFSHKFSDLHKGAESLSPKFDHNPSESLTASEAILYTMTTCHSLRLVDDELVGDPLDLKMFEFTKWSFQEEGKKAGGADGGANGDHGMATGISPPVVRPPAFKGTLMNGDLYDSAPAENGLELGVFKSFEFVSHLRRTSVIVKQFRAAGGNIYVKGAPECMKEICKPESFPADYDELLAHYTHRGYRVIGCATKYLPKLSWIKAQKMKRTDAESGLDFVGFIIFENKLKPQTAGVIEELSQAAIRKVMCTGDNILTAISVARECNLVDRDAHIFVPHFAEGDFRTANSRLQWESVDDREWTLDEQTLLPLPAPDGTDLSGPYQINSVRGYSLAVSGDVFRWIIDYAPKGVLHRMLVRGQVFARMSPDEKHELVEKLQSLEYSVGFCGDGANDCGALKAADVGISLSEAEASVAAPFTSRVFDISCVPEVIREGRAALVTSFSCFKFMSLYSAIQFTSVSILYRSASNLGDIQFLFIDLFLILPLAVFMGWSGPHPVLCPKRPTASLVSRKVLVPLLGQILLQFIIQLGCYMTVKRQSWYIPPVIGGEKTGIFNSENTTLFLVSCFQYIGAAVVLSVGAPFRQPMRENVPFAITVATGVLFSAYMVLYPATWLYDFMQLTDFPFSFKWFLLIIAAIGFSLLKLALSSGPKKHKIYKMIEKEMRL